MCESSLQLWDLLGSPFGTVLEHHVYSGSFAEVLGDPVEDGFGAAFQMVGEQEDADYEFAVFVGVQMVPSTDVPVFGSVGDSFGALVVSVFEVEEVDICESCEEVGCFLAVVGVGVPDDWHVYIDMVERF